MPDDGERGVGPQRSELPIHDLWGPTDVNHTFSQVLAGLAPLAPSIDTRNKATTHNPINVSHSPQQVAAALTLTVGMWEVSLRVIIKFYMMLATTL